MNGITVRAQYRRPDKRRRDRPPPTSGRAEYVRALTEARRASTQQANRQRP